MSLQSVEFSLFILYYRHAINGAIYLHTILLNTVIRIHLLTEWKCLGLQTQIIHIQHLHNIRLVEQHQISPPTAHDVDGIVNKDGLIQFKVTLFNDEQTIFRHHNQFGIVSGKQAKRMNRIRDR